MSNLTKRLSVVFAASILLMAGLAFFKRQHFWWRVGEAETWVASGRFGTATVYRSTEGNLLFHLVEDSLQDRYIFYPSDGRVGIPNGGQFIHFPFAPFVAISKDAQPAAVFSDDRIKVETDMNIIVEGNWLEFDTRGSRRIRADLSSY